MSLGFFARSGIPGIGGGIVSFGYGPSLATPAGPDAYATQGISTPFDLEDCASPYALNTSTPYQPVIAHCDEVPFGVIEGKKNPTGCGC